MNLFSINLVINSMCNQNLKRKKRYVSLQLQLWFKDFEDLLYHLQEELI